MALLPNEPTEPTDLYQKLNLISQIRQPLWKVSQLVVLQSRTQVLRSVTSPLTIEVLKNVEVTLQFRKYYEEQLCQFYNYGVTFVNTIVMERLRTACWYVYALQLKCLQAKKSDVHIPHHLLIELTLHQKSKKSWFAKKIFKQIKKTHKNLDTEPVQIIPFDETLYSDEQLRAFAEAPIGEEKEVEYLTVVLHIKIGQKNEFEEDDMMQDDPKTVVLTVEDEKYLASVKTELELNHDSLGKMTVKHVRPAVVT